MEISHSALSSDGIDDDVSTRPDSSRLSLGSSPSELSDDEDPPHGSTLGDDDFALDDGDGSLTPTDKVDINDEDDIVLGGSSEALFSSDSSDTLSNASMDMDDRVDDEDDEEEQDERQDDDPPSPSKDQEKENTNEHIQDAKENGPVSGKKQGKKRRNSDETEQEEWDKRRASKVLSKKEESLLAVAALENGDKNAGSIESPKTEQENGDEEGDDDEKDEAENDTPTLPTKEEEQNIAKAHEDDEDGSQEYERWHTEALEALTKIEVEFARLRDKMYQEKMAELNEEALMIAQGTHPELVAMMKTIEEKRNKRIKTAEAWRKYKQMNHQQQFEGLEYQANVDFIARKGALRRRIISSLSRKRWELDNEREKLNEPLSDADRVPDPNVLIPRKRQAGQESKELHRIQRSVGFPRAPGAEGLSLKTIEDDLNALGLARKPNDMDVEKSGNTSISNLARQGFNANTMNALPSNASGSVYTNQGLLFYHGQVFRKGDQFTIVDATAGRFSAKFLMATDTEVHIQRTDGSKTKLPLAQLARGKYQLFSKHS